MWLTYVLTWILLLALGIRKIVYLVLRFKAFVASKEDMLELPMMAVVFASLVASKYNILWQTHIGAFSVLFLWIKITSIIGRFPTFGIYINMMTFIFWTLVMFFAIYFFTFFGKIHMCTV